MKFHHIPIVIIGISLIIIGGVGYISELSVNYNQTADLSNLNKTTKYLETEKNLSIDFKNRVQNITSVGTYSDYAQLPVDLIVSGWIMARLMLNSWGSVEGLISDSALATEAAGVPILNSTTIAAIIAVIWISLGAILIYAFFKWKFDT